MADIIYYANEIDTNGELHYRKVQEDAAFASAELQVQRIEHKADDYPRTDPALIEFHEPTTDEVKHD